ncbi:MAG: hypothetical protein IT317_06160 [Anaerolineales bacterium]|nr:hypothetical protein [Anaerolineales bacterium]
MKPMPLHAWIRPIAIAFLPRSRTPGLNLAIEALFAWLREAGCTIQDQPDNNTNLIITTGIFGEWVGRDEALLFHAKRLHRLSRRPTILTMVDVPEAEFQTQLDHFRALGGLAEAEAAQVQYDGLGPQAAEVIAHQARRGGAELAIGRYLQTRYISIRVMAVRTLNERPYRAVHYDLAGARPVSDARDLEAFAAEVGARLLAAVCATEVNHHVFAQEPVAAETWAGLATPDAMVTAGLTFTRFGFFTTPIQVDKLLGYRGIGDAISAQFSEGCYGVYEPEVNGLITTATGSSRLVDKRAITRADQAVVTGVLPTREGALVRPVEGMEMVVPSVEAVEMMGICEAVAGHERANRSGGLVRVPNVRAILHGHLGVESYDPAYVEAVTLDPLYYTQLVSCGTGPLASGTAAAFSRSQSLRDVSDPRQVVFLEQPGHGVMMVEKWPALGSDAPPFTGFLKALEAGRLRMSLNIAQGPMGWEQRTEDGHTILQRILPPESAGEAALEY